MRIQSTMSWPWPGEEPLVCESTLSGKGPSTGGLLVDEKMLLESVPKADPFRDPRLIRPPERHNR